MTDDDRLRDLLRATSERVRGGDALSAIHGVRRRVHRRRFVRTGAAAGTAATVAAVAILASGSGGGASPPPVAIHQLPPLHLAGALTTFNACDDYLDYVRAQALKLVGPYGLQPGGPIRIDFGNTLGSAYDPKAASSGTSATPVAHSGTTNQVAGVDEPDTVKTDGRVVVTLNGPTLRILDLRSTVLGTLQLSGDTSGGLLLDGSRAVVLSSAAEPPSFGYFRDRNADVTRPARAAVIDLSNPSRPRLLHTFEFDGSVVATRLVGNDVRLVLRSDGPRLTFQTPDGPGTEAAATAVNRRLIENTTLDDWLPSWQLMRPDGSTTARQRLAPCDAVARPQHATGISTVTVVSLDPQAPAPGPAMSVVAAGDTVYATANHVYVAGAVDVTSRPRTWIYDFLTHGADRPQFLGAGSVPGTLLNSYAMDEAENGDLRVASTASTVRGALDSRITVLSASGRTLLPVGTVSGLGRGQRIRAVRFLADTAYVVTFRSFDPLYVVDLRDRMHPRVAGQLEQPGFSEFLYPLPNHLLLGVGVEIGANEPAGLLLAVYDVSNPARPRRLHAVPLFRGFFPADGYDPHAFLYWTPSSLAVVAVPNVYGSASAATAYRVGTTGSLSKLARFAHGSLAPDRTAVIGANVWAFTPGGVLVAPLTHLATTSWHPY